MEHFFYHIFKIIQKHKVVSFCSVTMVFFMLIFVSSKLNFEEDITKLIPETERTELLNKVLNQVDFADKIVVHLTVENNGDSDDLTQAATELKQALELKCKPYISEIQGVVNDDTIEQTLEFVYNNLPLFLSSEDYKKIEQKLTKKELKQTTANNYKSLISPSGFVTRNSILKDPLGITLLGLQKLKELQLGDEFIVQNGFVVTQNKKDLLLFIKPKLAPNETDKNTAFVAVLNDLKTSLNHQYNKKVSVSYYGATMIAVANANQIKKDIQLTVSVALSVLFIILIVFYKRLSIPIILFIPTVFGALLAISFLYLFRGTISAISIGIGSILLGITLDFSLHILTHYRNNSDVSKLYKNVTKPIVMSSITTAMAFLCLLFVKSRALQDLGLFAAISVLGASFSALIIIPHLYRGGKTKLQKKNTVIDAFASYSFSKNKVLVIICLLLSISAAFMYSKVVFDKDISKMNYQTEELLHEETVLNNLLNTTSKSLYIIAHSNTLDNALEENETVYAALKKLKEVKKIKSFSSVASVILSEKNQEIKINSWENFWTKNKQKRTQTNLINEGAVFGFKPTSFNKFYNKINQKPKVIDLSTYSDVSALNTKEFIANTNEFYTVLSSCKVKDAYLKEVKSLFSGNENIIVIDRQAMNETFLKSFKDNFNTLLGYSFMAVILVLLVFFKRLELVIITVIPIVLTWLITLGIMGVFGITFNIFNIIISTFIFGLGVDYAIFMTNGLVKEYETGEVYLPVYRTSIILSVITTILGVGVLIFAKHPALHSIASVCLIGIGIALLTTFVIQPIVFKALITNRAKNGLAPLELRKTLHSFVSFAFYGLGGMLLSLLAITVLRILPFNKKIKFKWLHNTMANLATSVLYSNPFVNKKVILNNELFEKQAVIIANHTSFLDTLAIALVTPKVIFLVNDWVYKSPIFGQLAKVAGYYPVSSGVEGSLDHLKEKINQGYSLVVFPEGKRMYSNKIGRFRKGAFYLAQELELDVLPLYIHGNSEVLPKGDYIIYNGSITVKSGDRISMNDPKIGHSIKDKTKSISQLFKSEFQHLREELEHPNYFKQRVLSNFLYKSEVITKAVKKDLVENIKTYNDISKLIALNAKLVHVANDYGQLDLLLNYYSNTRKIYTYISNVEQRKIAVNNFIGKDRSISYLNELILPELIDTLLISTPTSLEGLDIKSVTTIIILNQCIEPTLFLNQHYTITYNERAITVLLKDKN
mgnify:CR=1 FL=1